MEKHVPAVAHKTLPLDLIVEVYDAVVARTESLEVGRLGADLVYLVGAIAKGGHCAWPADRPILGLLRRAFGPDHGVWQYIAIE